MAASARLVQNADSWPTPDRPNQKLLGYRPAPELHLTSALSLDHLAGLR